jgi:hypothetical protein
MPRYTGVSSSTPVNLVVDAGAVYFNYGTASQRLLGATRGGNTFVVTQEFRVIEADGVPGAISDMIRIINVDPTMEVNMLEFSKENLLVAFPGAELTDYPNAQAKTHDEISRVNNVSASDFLENIALVGTVQGKTEPIICLLYNVLQRDNMSMQRQDDDESVVTLTFHGHFDVTDLETEPWKILYPAS